MSEMVLVEQRGDPSDAILPWILDEQGRRMAGQDDGRRLSELCAGLTRHAGVTVSTADAADDQLERTLLALHEPGYLRALGRVSSDEPVLLAEFAAPGLAPDTPVSAELVAVAHEGVRTAIAAAERIVAGARFAYALCRPPGHHAGPGWLGGYCYLNTATAAVRTLRAGAGGPVGILDLDIHYPNGTAAILARMPDTSLYSLHASPVVNSPSRSAEPLTVRERVIEFGEPPTEAAYLHALASAIDALAQSATMLVLSLGYDTVAGDPHGCWDFSPRIFTQIGRLLAATRLPVCIVQEGGYALDSLAACGHAFANGLLGNGSPT
jgi:acetoin utilization deacetylase AcuC-like enzyme